ncbi:Hypothetical protein A7982_09888 [Minicystis rosea]|nr:Hypothetical protein A7982_09888 [Minicystis rosea]
MVARRAPRIDTAPLLIAMGPQAAPNPRPDEPASIVLRPGRGALSVRCKTFARLHPPG